MPWAPNPPLNQKFVGDTARPPWRNQISHEVDMIVRSNAAGDAAVPGCPGWVVEDVLRHLGSVLYRAGLIIGERRTRLSLIHI